ncbi:MAG TPA: winged helix-turn-helix domain-containing protein [Anaerolineae bacterium]|nr:winged helix-turn-helix domain-containing protein [Anaerolineae bacterium]
MHVLIFALTLGIAEEIQTALDDTADRYTVAITWPDVLASLEDDAPDVVLVERAALAPLEPTILLDLTDPSRWPPVVLVDAPAAGAKEGVVLTQRLAQAVFSFYQIGKLRIDTRKKRVELGPRRVTLPPLQYRLLLTLAKRAGEVVSHRELLRAVWGYDGDDNEARELLKVHIRQIRRRLRLDQEEHPYIHSVRGFGYMLIAPEEE